MKILDFKKKKAEKRDGRDVSVVINVSVLKELVDKADSLYRENLWQGLAILLLALLNLFWCWIYFSDRI